MVLSRRDSFAADRRLIETPSAAEARFAGKLAQRFVGLDQRSPGPCQSYLEKLIAERSLHRLLELLFRRASAHRSSRGDIVNIERLAAVLGYETQRPSQH